MSNPNVGLVYQAIIRDVVDSARVDFEESGVEESVLEELAQVSSIISRCAIVLSTSSSKFCILLTLRIVISVFSCRFWCLSLVYRCLDDSRTRISFCSILELAGGTPLVFVAFMIPGKLGLACTSAFIPLITWWFDRYIQNCCLRLLFRSLFG
jgi:hypothetical protein